MIILLYMFITAYYTILYSETSRQFHLPRKQCLIDRDRHRHATNKGMDSYNRLSVMWKSDLTDKMKRSFFQAATMSILLYRCVAERTSYFCLVRKLIWLLGSSHIFTQWGWLILFNPDHFLGQHKNGESPPNDLFLRTFRDGRTYFLSTPFIAAEAQHHEESLLIYEPLESTLLDQRFTIEHELDARNPPHTRTPLCRF